MIHVFERYIDLTFSPSQRLDDPLHFMATQGVESKQSTVDSGRERIRLFASHFKDVNSQHFLHLLRYYEHILTTKSVLRHSLLTIDNLFQVAKKGTSARVLCLIIPKVGGEFPLAGWFTYSTRVPCDTIGRDRNFKIL